MGVPLSDCGVECALSLLLHKYREVELFDIDFDSRFSELFLQQHGQLNAHLAGARNGKSESKRSSVAGARGIGVGGAPAERVQDLPRTDEIEEE